MKVWNVKDPEVLSHSGLVVVRADLLQGLANDRAELSALEAAGLDNWQGHDAADWERAERQKARVERQIDAALNWSGSGEVSPE